MGIRSFGVTPRTAVGMYASAYTGSQQVYEHPLQMLTATMELVPMTRESGAGDWIGALWSLNGPAGTFYMGDTAYISPRGVGTGSPLVKGASQSGNTLLTDGWTNSQTGILKAGDWIQVGSGSTRQLCRIVADADSDGSGNATLEIWPRIRTAFADNTAITVTSPKGVWRLVEPVGHSWDVDKFSRGITINCMEAF